MSSEATHRGRYDLIGDVHGNREQLEALLGALGYVQPDPFGDPLGWRAPEGACLVSVGDLVDRGPDSLGCLAIVLRMVANGDALWVPGNHEWRLRTMLRFLLGLEPGPGSFAPSRLMTWSECLTLDPGSCQELVEAIDGAPPFLTLDEGRAIVCHAGWSPAVPRSERLRQVETCLFGRHLESPASAADPERQDVSPGNGLVELSLSSSLPQRARWVRALKREPHVFWGHEILRPGAVVTCGPATCLESGCYQGHALSAFVYPEGRVVQVPGPVIPWRTSYHRYQVAEHLVFPRSLELVRQVIEDETLNDPDDYVAWLSLELEVRDCQPLSSKLEATHRGIFARCV